MKLNSNTEPTDVLIQRVHAPISHTCTPEN